MPVAIVTPKSPGKLKMAQTLDRPSVLFQGTCDQRTCKVAMGAWGAGHSMQNPYHTATQHAMTAPRTRYGIQMRGPMNAAHRLLSQATPLESDSTPGGG